MSDAATRVASADPQQTLLLRIADKITPLFLGAGLDAASAREAAISAITAYNPEGRADFVSIARILAFSMAALTALGLAAGDDVSLAHKMRYFGRANALNRSAEQTERTMMRRRQEHRAHTPAEHLRPEEAAAPDQSAMDAGVNEAMQTFHATQPIEPKVRPPVAKVPAASTRPLQPRSDQSVLLSAAAAVDHRTPYRQGLMHGSAIYRVPGGSASSAPA